MYVVEQFIVNSLVVVTYFSEFTDQRRRLPGWYSCG